MCAEIQSDSPSPASWSAADRLGSSALGGIIGVEWGQSGVGWEGGGGTDGAETDSITASSAPVLPAANPNIEVAHPGAIQPPCHEDTPPPIAGHTHSSENPPTTVRSRSLNLWNPP